MLIPAFFAKLLLIFPLFSQLPTQSEIISPLANGEVLGASTQITFDENHPEEKYYSLIGQVLQRSAQNQQTVTGPDIFPKTFTGNIKILLLGSTSFVQLTNGQQLIDQLQKYYPKIKFSFVNYSSKQSDLDYALAKTQDTYLENSAPQSSVIFQEPDILLIDTFGFDQKITDPDSAENHVQKLLNLANLVFSYDKSQNIFLTNLTPGPKNNLSGHVLDPNQQYALAARTLENISTINLSLQQKNASIIDLTTPSTQQPTDNPAGPFLNEDLTLTDIGQVLVINKIVDYLINNQTIDAALTNQKTFGN